MDNISFWNLVESAGPDDETGDKLRQRLSTLSTNEVASFDSIFCSRLAALYTNRIWGAGYLAEGGMSDDAFEYFRTWVVMQGREIFDSTIADPDSLAALDSIGTYEGPQYAAGDVHKERTGDYPTFASKSPEASLGEDWNFDDDTQMQARYPRLWQKYA